MAKSAYEIWKDSKAKNLSDNEMKKIMKSEGVIVKKNQHLPTYEGNWFEDFTHENGNYENVCKVCDNHFLGHKRRVVCKCCS